MHIISYICYRVWTTDDDIILEILIQKYGVEKEIQGEYMQNWNHGHCEYSSEEYILSTNWFQEQQQNQTQINSHRKAPSMPLQAYQILDWEGRALHRHLQNPKGIWPAGSHLNSEWRFRCSYLKSTKKTNLCTKQLRRIFNENTIS